MNVYFYSASTGGFYIPEVHGDDMPEDAVEITAKQHADLLSGQSSGKIITSDTNGIPVLIDPPPMTEDQLKEYEIYQDKKYLADTDWIIARIGEASLSGQDTAPLLAQYATEIEQRELARVRIRIAEGRA